jgi:hypothetical protein
LQDAGRTVPARLSPKDSKARPVAATVGTPVGVIGNLPAAMIA